MPFVILTAYLDIDPDACEIGDTDLAMATVTIAGVEYTPAITSSISSD